MGSEEEGIFRRERMFSMKQKVTTIISMVAAIVLWAGPWTVFATCPVGETIMKCHWCCIALIPLAIVLLASGIMQLVAKQPETKKLLGVVSIVAFVGAILLPAYLIGGCAKPEMSCNVLTFPSVYAASAIGIIAQAIGIFTGNKQN